MMLWLVLGGTFSFCVLWLYQKLTWGVCTSKKDLSGKTAIVTGANTGIGLEIAKDLAKRNAKVILACRDQVKARAAVKLLNAETGNSKLIVKELDLASMSSVRKFCDEIFNSEESLSILINNAGVCNVPYAKTDEGLEINMASNHFGPFLLSVLLLDLLKKSTPSRIVNTTSIVHGWTGQLNLANLNSEQGFKRDIYMKTKLANVLFTRELARKLEGTGVTVNCVHPGTVRTELLRHIVFPINYFMKLIGFLCFKSPAQGAQTTLHCALSEELEDVTGQYFVDCNITRPGKYAQDMDVAKRLWQLSEGYTKKQSL